MSWDSVQLLIAAIVRNYNKNGIAPTFVKP